MKKAISFMAIARGAESHEVEVKRYMGLGAVGVIAVNPSREELNKIYGSSNSGEEPKYLGETVVKNSVGEDVKVPQLRLSFITKTDPKIGCNSGMEVILPVNIFVSKGYLYSTKNGVTKVKVIDAYGRTAWVTSDELKAGKIPEYEIKKGPNTGKVMKAQISEGYRPCYIGEEELCKFLIALINIPRPDVWDEDERTYKMKTDPKELAESECRLDNINALFSGNIKELKDAVSFQPNNRLKMLFGVRTAQNGNLYQAAYIALPLKLATTSLKPLEDALKEDREVGRHPSETYEICNLKEYKVSATDYAAVEEKTDNDPFAASAPQPATPAPEPSPLEQDADPFGATM